MVIHLNDMPWHATLLEFMSRETVILLRVLKQGKKLYIL